MSKPGDQTAMATWPHVCVRVCVCAKGSKVVKGVGQEFAAFGESLRRLPGKLIKEFEAKQIGKAKRGRWENLPRHCGH